MKILVTGATGFVGSHLCELLSGQGHDVYALARNEEKFKQFKVQGKMILGALSDKAHHQWVDQLPDDLAATIHTAGVVHSFNIDDFYKINTEATKTLYNDLKQKYKNHKFIFISSLSAQGPSTAGKSKLEEEHVTPVSHYGKSKSEAEKFLRNDQTQYIQKIIIRPPMVLGPRDPAALDIYKMVQDGIVLSAGMGGPSSKTYSFVSVFDLNQTIVNALNSSDTSSFQIYNSSYPDTFTLDKMLDHIKQIMHKKNVLNINIPIILLRALASIIAFVSQFIKINVRLTPDKLNELAPDAWTCSPSKSQQLLNVEYKWPLERTLEVTLEDYQSRHWL